MTPCKLVKDIQQDQCEQWQHVSFCASKMAWIRKQLKKPFVQRLLVLLLSGLIAMSVASVLFLPRNIASITSGAGRIERVQETVL